MEGRGGVLTPGFRFYPTEEELVSFYLKHKIGGDSSRIQTIDRVIPQLHVYDFNPWDLPQYAGEPCHKDPEQWFFFIPRQEKEARGGRPCRLTSSGYWKATGSPTVVYSSGNRGIGMKRTMVFYSGRAPTGRKTQWKMNEYKAFKEETASRTSPNPELMQELSLCRVYIKSHCLRAFDRRPSGVTTSESQQHVQQTLHDHQATLTTSSTHMNRDSPDPSHNSSQDQTSMQIEDNQPLPWDWEKHLDWF